MTNTHKRICDDYDSLSKHAALSGYEGQLLFLMCVKYGSQPIEYSSIDIAAKNGNLDNVISILTYNPYTYTKDAMIYARDNGHYNIEQYLISRLPSIDI